MTKIYRITERQYQRLASVNEQMAALENQRNMILELILDSSPDAGKKLEITKISPAGIEYVLLGGDPVSEAPRPHLELSDPEE